MGRAEQGRGGRSNLSPMKESIHGSGPSHALSLEKHVSLVQTWFCAELKEGAVYIYNNVWRQVVSVRAAMRSHTVNYISLVSNLRS